MYAGPWSPPQRFNITTTIDNTTIPLGRPVDSARIGISEKDHGVLEDGDLSKKENVNNEEEKKEKCKK